MTDTILNIAYFSEWLAAGERGVSSNAIVSQLTGARTDRHPFAHDDHPYDPSDFRRCEALLDAYPFARPLMGQMRSRSKEWAALVDHWEEIREALVREQRDRTDHTAPETYDLMKHVLKQARA